MMEFIPRLLWLFVPPTVSYDHIHGVMALTLFEDFIYWTDGKSKSLRRAHKTTGAQGMELLNSWQAIKSIKVYHSLRQPEGIRPSATHVHSTPSMLSSSIVLLHSVKSRMVHGTPFCPLHSTQTPVSDCKRRMQPPVSSIAWRGAQMCLSH